MNEECSEYLLIYDIFTRGETDRDSLSTNIFQRENCKKSMDCCSGVCEYHGGSMLLGGFCGVNNVLK